MPSASMLPQGFADRKKYPETTMAWYVARVHVGQERIAELGLIVKNLLDSVDWSATPLQRFMAV